ncbi:hypothetical protein OF83DRAFT_559541 [Amylostereum chailletii]|nr:hypothetical protein OF83DRAFT_559541 [Amylostereum chailletii]
MSDHTCTDPRRDVRMATASPRSTLALQTTTVFVDATRCLCGQSTPSISSPPGDTSQNPSDRVSTHWSFRRSMLLANLSAECSPTDSAATMDELYQRISLEVDQRVRSFPTPTPTVATAASKWCTRPLNTAIYNPIGSLSTLLCESPSGLTLQWPTVPEPFSVQRCIALSPRRLPRLLVGGVQSRACTVTLLPLASFCASRCAGHLSVLFKPLSFP